MNNKTNNLESIWKILPRRIRESLIAQIPDEERLQEIRLRAGQEVLFYCGGQEYTLKPEECNRITPEEIQETIQYATGYSLYAYEQEMKQGYITIEGGHRIGIAGQVIMEQNGVPIYFIGEYPCCTPGQRLCGCCDAISDESGQYIQYIDHCTSGMWKDNPSQRSDPADCEWMRSFERKDSWRGG